MAEKCLHGAGHFILYLGQMIGIIVNLLDRSQGSVYIEKEYEIN
jgi:hypothetical protein